MRRKQKKSVFPGEKKKNPPFQNSASPPETQSATVMSKESMLGEFFDVFAGEGKLEGDLHLEIDPSVTPVQLPTKRVPLAVKEMLKTEISRLEKLNWCH